MFIVVVVLDFELIKNLITFLVTFYNVCLLFTSKTRL